ncbi:MAG: iron ABC transporter substrate-binding protein [Actinobacteria bacterium]|nr:iron ABC transporter substrate-binding protein [Actinomycetota bacterium]
MMAGALVLLTLAAAACDDGTSAGASGGAEETLTIYSGREEEYVEGLFEDFEKSEGIDLEVRYGDSAELAATLAEEGEASPADVFFSQDAGSLGAVAGAGLFAEIDEEVLGSIDERFRSPENLWVGTSARARVAAYNTEALAAEDMPDSVLDFAEPEWEGRIGFPPTNASFQAFVAALILLEGEDTATEFLEGLVANEPLLYEDNEATLRAVADGEVEVGLVNHYYLYEVAAEEGDIPVANHFFDGGDPGALVNVAGVGILATTDGPDAARRFVEYVTGEPGQTYFPEATHEYPVAEGFNAPEDLPPLDDIEAPEVDLSDLAGTLEPALELMAEVGLL